MKQHRFRLLMACMISIMLVLSGCSSDGVVEALGDEEFTLTVGQGDGTTTGELNDDGIDTGIAATATTVQGKVTLSSIISGKAQQKAAMSHALKHGKPGSQAYNKALSKAHASMKTAQERALPSRAAGAAFSNGIVELYNSSHPGWIYPVATTTTDSEGNYTLDVLSNADNNGNAYEDGGLIPGGNYTLLAYTIHPKTSRPYLVALQSVVSQFAGSISGIDLVAQTSTAEPTITTMLGVAKNSDGTQTWGDADLVLAPNAAIQVAFSMPMKRTALTETELEFASASGAAIPAGTWTLSADWLTATYYLNDGESWPVGDTYSLTVYGADTTVEKMVDGFPFTGEDLATYNVFGKSLKLSGVGTFTIPEGAIVDTQSPTAQLSSPTLAQTANPIEITTPIRIASNERMDVNGLRLKAEPSLGDQPGVLFVGKNDDDLYEYEFILGKPMKLGTTYDAVVSGGSDLAGNVMNDLTVSFSTVTSTEGVLEITADSTPEEIATAEAQADVKDVFGKWVRAFDDRNLPQLQSLMTGDFFMEYPTTDGFDESDINRDGLYDLQEFSGMISNAFIAWDFCGVEISGSVVDTINIVGDEADFEFVLSATTENTSQDCKNAAPDDSLFATLEKINGAWFIKRASEGVDTRGQEIVQATLLELVSPDNGTEHAFFDPATNTETDIVFEWAEVADVASYAWIIVDSRNPRSGFALILPTTMTSLNIPSDIDTLLDAGTIADVSEDFGFEDDFEPRDGSELYWQVAALEGNTVRDVQDGRQTDLPKDVAAISELYRFKIAGDYQELSFSVEAAGAPITFSEMIHGFDAGDSSTATITVTSPREGVTEGLVIVEGNTHEEYPFTFTGGVGSVEIQLNQGQNHIGVMDGVPCWSTPEGCGEGDDKGDRDFIEEWFQVITTGGIAPVLNVASVIGVNDAAVETAIVNDGWNFYESSDAVAIKVTGSVDCDLADCMKMRELHYNVWNDMQHANANGSIEIDPNTGDFSAEIEVYMGENWINLHASICEDSAAGMGGPGNGCQDFNANFGVKTAAGSEYVAPFQDIVVTEDTIALVQKENWGNGGNWVATGSQVVITGVMQYGVDSTGDVDPLFEIGSDGGWQSDRLFVDPTTGAFELVADLYNGHNYINVRDVKDNWYHINVYTEGGNVVVRPEITMIDGAAFAGGDHNTDQCSVNLSGTAMPGQMHVYWNANGELKTPNEKGETFANFWMEEKLEVGDDGAFDVTMPLIGGTAYSFSDNFIDVFDNNWNWMGVRVVTSGNCEFTPPQMSVTGATLLDGSPLYTDMLNDYGEGGDANFRADADWSVMLVADQIVLEGSFTGNVSNIKVDPQCGASINATVDVATSTWTATVDVFDGYNNFNITDGRNWWWVNVENVEAEHVPTPPINGISVTAGAATGMNHYNGCSNSDWEFDSMTAVSEITITGVAADSASMKGEFHYDGGQGHFDFDATGAFTITVPVFQGHNHIGINDADWNFMSVNINVMDGPQRPAYVTVDPVNPMTDGSPTIISGEVLNQPSASAATFIPERISVQVNERVCTPDPMNPTDPSMAMCDHTWQEYTTDPNGFDWGAMPMTLDGPDANGNFTFEIHHSFSGEPDRINIWVDGQTNDGMWANHGLDLPLFDDPGCPDCSTPYAWKPGAKSSVSKQHNNPVMNNRLKALNARGK